MTAARRSNVESARDRDKHLWGTRPLEQRRFPGLARRSPDLYERNLFDIFNLPVDATALFSVHLRVNQIVPFAFAAFKGLDGFLEDSLIRFGPEGTRVFGDHVERKPAADDGLAKKQSDGAGQVHAGAGEEFVGLFAEVGVDTDLQGAGGRSSSSSRSSENNRDEAFAPIPVPNNSISRRIGKHRFCWPFCKFPSSTKPELSQISRPLAVRRLFCYLLLCKQAFCQRGMKTCVQMKTNGDTKNDKTILGRSFRFQA